ncbi:MAG: hypothetical protein IT364_10540 [Candidatus Hydrogenedentes bacterium]|nr:hypothetical protein [Candidatus Hydrogenedentota bacterium]
MDFLEADAPLLDGEEYSVEFEALALNPAQVEWAMGYEPGQAPEPVPGVIAELLVEASRHASVKVGVRLFRAPEVLLDGAAMQVDGVVLNPGDRIAGLLSGAREVAIYAATAGSGVDDWIRAQFATGDPVRGYVADTIGSELVERAADWLEERVIDHAIGLGCFTTSRFSPGFCEWDVSEQHALFSLLPRACCGITLTETALMLPVKSVSGLIGMGPECERATNACMVCTMKTCFRRR